MNPGTRKTASKKTVRLAATFTGAAACAFTFAPAAAHAALAQPTALPLSISSLSGGIRHGTCFGTNQSHWFHMGSENEVACYGGRGIFLVSPPAPINSFCGGNNSGHVDGSGTNGPKDIKFGHGTYWAKVASRPFYVTEVSIKGWGGTDKCPTFP